MKDNEANYFFLLTQWGGRGEFMSNSWCIMTPNTILAFVTVGACVSWSKDFCSKSRVLKLWQAHTQTHKTPQPLNNNMIQLECWILLHIYKPGNIVCIAYTGAVKSTYKMNKDTPIDKKKTNTCCHPHTQSHRHTGSFWLFGRQLAQCDIDSSVPIPHWELHLLALLPIQVKRLQTHTMQSSVCLPRRKPAL